MPNPSQFDCALCGEQATQVYDEPKPDHFIFLCGDCSGEDEFLLETLEPTFAPDDQKAKKIKDRLHQRRYRYIRRNNPELPDYCQVCGAGGELKSKPAKPLESPWLVYRVCLKCVLKDNIKESPIDIRNY